ncbi:MAG: hypothetical protein AAGU27_02460 [Dehalobacterium sp.]
MQKNTSTPVQTPVVQKGFTPRFPHALVLLFLVIVLAAALSYVIPAGQYERVVVDGKTTVNPESFTYIEQSPVGFFGIFRAIPNGLMGAGTIVFLILLVGGAVEVITETGALKCGISSMVKRIGEKNRVFALVALMFVLAVIGGWLGWIEAAIPFIPLTIAIVLALGYDSITAVGVTVLGLVLGFAAGPTNMYTVGVAHGIAELPIFSGIGYRIIIWLSFVALGIHRVISYAKMVEKNPERSLVKDVNVSDLKFDISGFKPDDFTGKHKLILLTLVLSMVVILFGMLKLKWSIMDMAALFVITGIVTALIGKIPLNKMAEIFVRGASKVLIGAMIVGVARGIQWTLDQGLIIDTIIHSLAVVIGGLPPSLTAIGMFFVQMIINFFIPSGSGQAMAVMPIMIPLSDLVGVTRQTATLAFQLGDGFSNIFYFSFGTLMFFLSLGRVSYDKWVKFVWPVMWKGILLSIIFVYIASMINYGPF